MGLVFLCVMGWDSVLFFLMKCASTNFFFEGKCATNNIFFENSVLPIIDKHPFHVSTSLPIIGEQLMGLFSYWMISRRTVGELSFWTYSYYCFSSLITRNPFFPKKASLPPKRTKLNTQTYVGMSHKVENVSYFVWTAKVNSQIRPLFTMMTISPRDITPKIHNFSRVMTGKKIQMASLLLEANENTFWFFFLVANLRHNFLGGVNISYRFPIPIHPWLATLTVPIRPSLPESKCGGLVVHMDAGPPLKQVRTCFVLDHSFFSSREWWRVSYLF